MFLTEAFPKCSSQPASQDRNGCSKPSTNKGSRQPLVCEANYKGENSVWRECVHGMSETVIVSGFGLKLTMRVQTKGQKFNKNCKKCQHFGTL